jgi:alcohol dehydrogenase
MDGTQAEYVRVPDADSSLYRIPDGVSDEEALMLADVLPTGYEVGVLNGGVRPGDVVAVIGTGPVGLAAVACARLFLMRLIANGQLDASRFITHHFGLDDIEQAYDVFADPAGDALKVMLTRSDEEDNEEAAELRVVGT